ncbi:MAG: DUF302 domain-containing protein [Gammaproteobacteria bacterium]|nr:DUF302 domain-containing protein [Gammaproteobacteria bacterium]
MSDYTLSARLNLPIAEAVDRLTEVMKDIGLGIVSDIDVQKTIKNKLDQDIAPYRIIGACNPMLAKRLIEAAPQAGALLPCNVVAREVDGETFFDFMAPKPVLGLETNPVAAEVANDADEKLRKVIAALAG